MTDSNFELFKKENNNYVYSFMAGRHKEVFTSMPLLKANLAVAKLGGVGDAPYIYLDSLLIRYADNALEAVYSLDYKNGFFVESFIDENGKTTRWHDEEPRLYMEYDVVVGDPGTLGYETLMVMTHYPRHYPYPTYGYVEWYKDYIELSRPNNHGEARIPEFNLVLGRQLRYVPIRQSQQRHAFDRQLQPNLRHGPV